MSHLFSTYMFHDLLMTFSLLFPDTSLGGSFQSSRQGPDVRNSVAGIPDEGTIDSIAFAGRQGMASEDGVASCASGGSRVDRYCSHYSSLFFRTPELPGSEPVIHAHRC